jgi:hypothetical protein
MAQLVTGILRDVEVCQIDETNITFLFGYVVTHNDCRYQAGDWFATSYIVNKERHDGYYIFTTANSTYLVTHYSKIIVPYNAITNIRSGTSPQTAIRICEGSFGKPS